MKVSINWIKDFVNLDGIDIKNLINKFTLGVAEVEGVEYKGKDISGVVTAKILSVDNVPNSTKLHLLKVDAGDETLQIVCGAPNVRVGLVTALAKIGAKIGDITISKATLAGIESYGMCCGGDEIGISDDHSGIVEFDDNTPIGVDIKKLFGVEDIIFEVDNKSLTNRPDLWGHYGIAREISALTGRALKPLSLARQEEFVNLPALDISVSSQDCYRYTGIKMENVLRHTSSIDMQIRLYYCGMRGINLLADVTNYVMLELGQPMHAFDGSVVNKIEVYNTTSPIEFTTLDGNVRTLKENTMVIATNSTPVALAGIMGGENSEIKDNTTSVLIESANFDSYKVRTTALSLGMRTEASARYEKSLDPELTMTALLRLVYLVKQLDKGTRVVSRVTDIYNKRYERKEIDISKSFIDNFVGMDISEEKILSILTSLEFKLLKNENGNYRFAVPTFRATKDINGKQDLVEEVTRIYGYDNITPKSLKQPLVPALLDRAIGMEYDAKYALATKFNMHETHSYIWYDVETNSALHLEPKSYIRCVNSINKENDKIRSTMIPSLLKVVLDNKGNYSSFGTFEVGRVVKGRTENNLADETKSLGVLLYNKNGTLQDELYKTKDVLDYLFSYIFKMPLDLKLATPEDNFYHPKNYYNIYSGAVLLGSLFAIHPQTTDAIEDGSVVTGFEINFSQLCKIDSYKISFEKLSKYPTTKLDFNFIIPSTKLYRDIDALAHSIPTALYYTLSLQNIYDNANGTKSYTLHYEVTSFDRTLTSEDIECFHKEVIATFEKNGYKLKL